MFLLFNTVQYCFAWVIFFQCYLILIYFVCTLLYYNGIFYDNFCYLFIFPSVFSFVLFALCCTTSDVTYYLIAKYLLSEILNILNFQLLLQYNIYSSYYCTGIIVKNNFQILNAFISNDNDGIVLWTATVEYFPNMLHTARTYYAIVPRALLISYHILLVYWPNIYVLSIYSDWFHQSIPPACIIQGPINCVCFYVFVMYNPTKTICYTVIDNILV